MVVDGCGGVGGLVVTAVSVDTVKKLFIFLTKVT